MRPTLNAVFEELGIDTFLTSGGTNLEDLCKLHKRFTDQTDQLQTASQSLSDAVPTLQNWEADPQSANEEKQITQVLLRSMCQHFAGLLDPTHDKFDSTAAAATVWDPGVSYKSSYISRETFVLSQATKCRQTLAFQEDSRPSAPGSAHTALQRFLTTKILSMKTDN